eukprot:11014461-Alexandrium_andersonii.AAC.1
MLEPRARDRSTAQGAPGARGRCAARRGLCRFSRRPASMRWVPRRPARRSPDIGPFQFGATGGARA